MRKCSLCDKKHYARGYCKKHYEQLPDQKAKRHIYGQRPEVKAKNKAYAQSPEGKAYKKEYKSRPENKKRAAELKKEQYSADPNKRAYAQEYASNWYHEHKEESREYHKSPKYKKSRSVYNKSQKVREKRNIRQNTEEYKEYHHEYMQDYMRTPTYRTNSILKRHERRALTKNKISQEEWLKIRNASPMCPACGRFVECENLTMDHQIPLKREGAKGYHHIANLSAICIHCNCKKKNTTLPPKWIIKSIVEKGGADPSILNEIESTEAQHA